jgi:LCP family protein required for cell wall assembly
MRRKPSRAPSIARKLFLATAGVLSFVLASGSGYAIYALHSAESQLVKRGTGPGCSGPDCLVSVDVKPGQCSKEACNFLILGSDSRKGLTKKQQSYYGNSSIVEGQRADTIILVRIDPRINRTVVVHIPRDLLVDIPGYGQGKINSAFSHGANVMVQTVEQLTGMQINHYVEVNFSGFRSIVDALGGVKICIDKPMIDQLSGLHLTKAGCHNLNGFQALAFVRARHVEGDTIPDFSRISRQQQFMRVIIQKLLSLNAILHFQDLVQAVSDNLVVDDHLKLYDLQDLTRKLSALGQSGVFFRVVPAVPVDINGVSYVQALPQAQQMFDEIRKGGHLSSIGREQLQTNLSPAEIQVKVYDAGSNGQAAKVVSYLQDAGFVVLPLESAPPELTTTQIIYSRSKVGEKNVVSSYLPTLKLHNSDSRVRGSGAQVVVVISPDFKGLEF